MWPRADHDCDLRSGGQAHQQVGALGIPRPGEQLTKPRPSDDLTRGVPLNTKPLTKLPSSEQLTAAVPLTTKPPPSEELTKPIPSEQLNKSLSSKQFDYMGTTKD